MGLDMYLTRRTYVKQWPFQSDKEKITVNVRRENIDIPGINKSNISYIIEEVMYWRKANSIHNWFVKNVQDGNDNCGEYYVNEALLKSLVSDCKKVLDNNTLAPKLLPSVEGFFFGSSNYDDRYFDDIKETADELTKILDDFDKSTAENLSQSFYYSSSW